MNRELISQAISNIDEFFIEESIAMPEVRGDHPSERSKEMHSKQQRRHINSRRVFGLILAACLVFTLAVTAYAADVGGIRRMIQIWLYGDQTTAVLDIQAGQYTLTDEAGDLIMGGGGVAIEPDGSERPLTEEELLSHLDKPDLWYKEDGTVWVFYHGEKIEITDMFDASGVCYLEVKDGDDVLYLTVTKESGMAVSSEAYVQPWEFRTEKEP